MVSRRKDLSTGRGGRDVLFAGPCVSEFGWELMCWQGQVRKLARNYDYVVICSTAGHQPLYEDFCDQFIPHRIKGHRDCWFLRESPDEFEQTRHKLDRLAAERRRNGDKVNFAQIEGFIPTSEQEFVHYGVSAGEVRRELHFDIVIHARSKRSHNSALDSLNWPQNKWDDLCKELVRRGLRVACIGSIAASLCARGAHDFRGVPLRTVINVLALTRLVVGPSSGPMHLASLCGTPHMVWTITLDLPQWKAWGSSRQRYEQIWNPFNTACRVIETPPDAVPNVATVLTTLTQMLEKRGG